jgi:hypothetical protein
MAYALYINVHIGSTNNNINPKGILLLSFQEFAEKRNRPDELGCRCPSQVTGGHVSNQLKALQPNHERTNYTRSLMSNKTFLLIEGILLIALD